MPLIAGVDEAGRGCLAGPVVAAAVILSSSFDKSLLKDSKQLTAVKRKAIYDNLVNSSSNIGIGIISSEQIDSINILNATYKAMEASVAELTLQPESILIDGNQVPPGLLKNGDAIIKGDQKIPEISAASIIAKVTRDRLMIEYHKQFPEYEFDKHNGYGTELHYDMVFKYGPCPIHRKSFNLTKQQTLFR
jgi:ribonuclease HII